ncbi:hypothetical protein [Microbispora sp. NPDC049125]|uniref:hypothetical protein n=1 Tax=Microbispora sp. NPDC049125 TaxID=3154929 RepID=UPI003466114D
MSGVTATARRPHPETGRRRTAGRPGTGPVSLMRFEGARLLRSPLLWGAAALTVALRTWQTWFRVPDWSVVTMDASYAGLIVAAAALMAANIATTRERRHGMPEMLGALPVRAPARTRALIVATPAVAAGVAGVATAVHLLSLLPTSAAGRFDPWEALTGPVAAALGAVLGVALGRWLPSLVAGPVAVFAFAVPIELGREGSPWAALLPVIVHHEVPVFVAPRPSAAHLVYLLAATLLLAGLGMCRHGLRLRRALAVVTGLAVAVPTGATAVAGAHFAPAEALAPLMLPSAHHCRDVDRVRYCAYPGYQRWIPLWSQAVHPVVAAIPPAARDRVPEIRQRVGFVSMGVRRMTALPPRWAHLSGPFFDWGRNGVERTSQAWLGGQVAAEVAGLPLVWYRMLTTDPHNGASNIHVYQGTPGCAAWGQARTLVALWLGGQAGPVRTAALSWAETEDSERRAAERLYGYAERLVRRPDARERVWANWSTLMDPKTTVEQGLPLLGLTPDPDDAERRACS